MDVAGKLYPTGRIGTTNYILTPENIVNDMINMLPADFWTPDVKVLDIFSKSGRFLMAAYKKLFNSPYLADMDVAKRKRHILTEQLFGLTDDFTCLLISERMLYGYAQYGKKNIRMVEDLQSIVKTTDKKLVAERLGKELGGQMEFDLVIGNPPYNNDLYLDFVTVAQHLSSKYTVMITPAKWQAKGGKKNEDFRKNIVPYMSTIVYYPDATELFDIAEVDGVCIYLLDKTNKFSKKTIVNRASKNNTFESILERNICGQLNNAAYKILNTIYSLSEAKHVKIKTSASHFGFKSGERTWLYSGDIQIFSNGKEVGCCSRQDVQKNAQDIEKWKVMVNQMVGYSFFYDEKGMSFGGNKIYILKPNQICGYNYFCLKVCDSYEEAISTKSYYDTKLVRFIMLTSLTTSSIGNDEAFRFIPDPGTFDHIFTDEELYKKYNLTDEEINIIESVIKERK